MVAVEDSKPGPVQVGLYFLSQRFQIDSHASNYQIPRLRFRASKVAVTWLPCPTSFYVQSSLESECHHY